MDEFELLIAIIVGIFKLIRWILVTFFKLLGGIFGLLTRGAKAARRLEPARMQPKKLQPAKVPATARPVTPSAGPALKELAARFDKLEETASAEAERCLGEEANLAFVETLRYIGSASREMKRRLATAGSDGKVLGTGYREAERLEALFEVLSVMSDQRRDRDLLELLGDADALAEACYRPIVDYCRNRGIKLISDRTATCIGGDKLFILAVDDPSGLAPIVLPAAWSTEIGWWPALAHEIAHDFYNSVPGLGDELRRKLSLPLTGKLPSQTRVTTADIDGAVGAWMEELFADAFGTMMLGPAFVATQSWSFGSPREPAQALAAAGLKNGNFEEHPPGHVRVACACRLLREMGYGAQGDKLEASWRRAHRNPELVYLPTRTGGWVAVDDDAVIARALDVGMALYETGLDALHGVPLRSIQGLDFGPREHELAHGVKDALLAGRRPSLRDPRLVISGAVVAWSEKPAESARILAVARDLIDAVGVPRRRPAGAYAERSDDPAAPDAALWRDAIILDALLQRRTARR
jgi:hypothetical protein